jgi:hypothetical protein
MNSELKAALAKLNQRQTRELIVTPKVLSEKEGTVEFVASDETLDCHREIVRVSGWKFTHFQKNAPFVDSHDYSSITKLLGQVTDFRVEKGQLVEVVRYSREPGTLAEWAFKMVRDGFLRAVSVGFMPVRMATRWDTDPRDFQTQLAELKLDEQARGQLRAVYLEQEQIELSQCVLGANPNALAKAYKAGCLNDEDLDKLSAAIAASKYVNPASDSADAGTTSPRTKLAILAGIQSLL